MKKLINLLVIALLVGPALVKAQVLSPSDDGIVPEPERHFHQNRVVPYPFLRQDDILWSERHWESIDLREKINLPLYYPIKPLPDRKSLWDVLKDAILEENSITQVFRDDRMTRPLTGQELQEIISKLDPIDNPDDPFAPPIGYDTLEYKANSVVAYRIKSDWYFDKQRGEMKNRIIAIAPEVKDLQSPNTFPIFWVWFPDARQAMANAVAYNEKNNHQRLTFDQIFHMRKFSSTIYKEDNMYDREIAEYKQNNSMNQLLEASRIREELRNAEHDMWTF